MSACLIDHITVTAPTLAAGAELPAGSRPCLRAHIDTPAGKRIQGSPAGP